MVCAKFDKKVTNSLKKSGKYQKVEKTKVKWVEFQTPTEYYTVTGTNGKIGLVDINGHQIVPCLFEKMGEYHPNKSTVVVKNGGKEGLYDIVKDSLTIACHYDRIFNYSGGVQYAMVYAEDCWGAVTLSDDVIFPCVFISVVHARDWVDGVYGNEPYATDFKNVDFADYVRDSNTKAIKDEEDAQIEAQRRAAESAAKWESIIGGLSELGNSMIAYQKKFINHQNIGNSESSVSSPKRIEKSSTESKFSLSEQTNYNNDKKTYERYDSQLASHFAGNMVMSKSSVENAQQEMKRLRTKWTNKGKSFPKSSNETR